MEDFNVENILGAAEIDSLFEDDREQETPKEESNENDDKETTENLVDENTLFTDSESVGSEEDIEDKEDTPSPGEGTSPNNFYSSIAQALREEGIFPDLNDEDMSKVKTPEDLSAAIKEQVNAMLDEKQRRIDEALNAGVDNSEIRAYEQTLNYLDSISDEIISDESDKGEALRRNLIYRDFINRGYSEARAKREVEKSFNAGSDVDDAKEALASNKEFFKSEYDRIIQDAKQASIELEKARKVQAEELKKSILEDKIIGDLTIDKTTRQKVFDNISKPTYKDPETGQVYTALQKYQKDNPNEFLKNVGILYTLTNGFKNLDGLVRTKVNKEVKKGFKELERTINNTSRTSDGTLKFFSGVGEDPNSFLGKKGWELDV